MEKKFKIQDLQYSKPYHHLVSFQENDERFFDSLKWGLEYYGYVSFILELAQKKSFEQVAEVGCGDGKILFELAQKYPERKFEGYDLSEKSITFANAYAYGLPHLSFFAKDFKEAEGKFDLILCVETLEHIPDEETDSFLKTIYEKMNTNSNLILSVPSTNLKLHKKHYRHYDLQLLKKQTGKLFNMEEHWFVHNFQATGCLFTRSLLYNRFIIINLPSARRLLFSWYRKYYRIATPKTGLHIVAILKKKQQ